MIGLIKLIEASYLLGTFARIYCNVNFCNIANSSNNLLHIDVTNRKEIRNQKDSMIQNKMKIKNNKFVMNSFLFV